METALRRALVAHLRDPDDQAQRAVQAVHDRMPVILAPKDFDLWIDRTIQEPAELKLLLAPYPAEEMRAFPIGPFVNDAKHEGAECVAPAP